jgi:hypothetical protein
MKYILTLCIALSFTVNVFSQKDTSVPNAAMKTDYLKKSKTQKTIAWVLLGSGIVLIGAGIIVGENGVNDVSLNEATSGAALIVAGAVVDIASIPFFILGAKNKRKALAVTFKNEFVPQLQQGSLVRTPTPTIGLTIRL